ncbi:LysR substrate-binding domain-containing protein, partial [Achromobacter xylosoxidans]
LGSPIAALLDRSHQLGIIAGEQFRHPRVAMQALSSVPMVAVVGASHPLAARVADGAPLATRELADHLQQLRDGQAQPVDDEVLEMAATV